MFDDQQRVSRAAQFEQHFEQFGHVMEMQAGGRLVQNIKRSAGGFAAEFGRQFDALRFAAAQGRRRLPEPDVAQADFRQRQAGIINLRHGAEKCHRFIHRHVEHVGDVLAFVIDLQRLAIVTAAIARFARHVNRRQEMHFNFDQPVALAFLATAAFDIETEPARLVAANFAPRAACANKSRIWLNIPV